ncbi:Zinc finger, RING-type [Sesbania bispinosa]|nr:Zinc finger, RING-type [Sesbania bispinosa]
MVPSISARTRQYHYTMWCESQPSPIPIPEDTFKFNIRVISHPTDMNANTRLTQLLHHPQERIRVQNLFHEGYHFLRTLLSHPQFSTEYRNRIVDEIIPNVCQLFPRDRTTSFDPSVQPQEFALNLIVVLYLDVDDELVVVEESLQDFRMIPASKKAIQMSLKKSKVTKENECCTICMEEFEVDGTVTMPCNHMFHQPCIVRWLETSHVCPLCRYPLPVNEEKIVEI